MENNKLREAKGWCKVDLFGLISNNQDLNKFFEVAKELNIEFVEHKPSLEEAIEVLCNALREDTSEGSFYKDWQDKIMISYKEEFYKWQEKYSNDGFGRSAVHSVATQAAKNFLNLLISK